MFSFFFYGDSAPTAPSGITLTQDSDANSWDVSWTDNSSDELGFTIQYEINNSGTWLSWGAAAANATSKNNNAVTGVQHGDSISVRVSAKGSPVSSAFVEVASPVTASFNAPTAPSSFTISEGSFGTVTGSFTDNSGNEDSFIVTASVAGGGAQDRETLAANTTSITGHLPAFYYTASNGDSYRLSVVASRFGRNSTAALSNQITLSNQPS